MHTHTVHTEDNRPLGVTTYPSASDSPHAAVVVAPAMGVSQTFYASFAQALSKQGFHVVTFDYRGIGASCDRPVQTDTAVLSDWGARDLHSILGWTHDRYPDIPLRMVGHSVGGQLVGLAPNNALLDAVYLVSSQSGWIFHWKGRAWCGIAALFGGVIPAVAPIFKKLPGSILGGADIPAGVALQWAWWGRRPGYLTQDTRHTLHFETLTATVRLVTIADDHGYAPPRAVRALGSWMTHATLRPVTLYPHTVGLRSIGHFGYFRSSNGPALWSHAVHFLRDPNTAR